MNKRRSLYMTLLACLIHSALLAEEKPARQFQNGDRICFIGDSITHGGSYQVQILLYYATRFPERKLEAFNCGIAGDYAGGVLRRYDWDIKPHKPTIATIMLGMNDVGRDYYGKKEVSADLANRRRWNLEGYAKNMLKLSEDLTATGCKLIYLTPSIYDQTGNQKSYNYYGVNDALGTCAKDCIKLADKFDGGLADVYSLMNKINAEQQKKNPSFTIVGGDRVHPGMAGHYVMAYTLLKAQQVPATVADMTIAADQVKTIKQTNCSISDLQKKAGGISFTCRANSLPFPMSPKMIKEMDQLIPFTNDLNKEVLTISGLSPGQYVLSIDGQPVQDCTAAELAKGINLAVNPKTPQHRQAWGVADPLWKWFNLESAKLRHIACIRHGVLARAKVDLNDHATVKKVLETELQKCQKRNDGYGASLIKTYLQYGSKRKQLEAEAADLLQKAFSNNKPKPHRYEVIKR